MNHEIINPKDLIPKKDWLRIRQEAFRLFNERGDDDRNWEEAFEIIEKENEAVESML